MSHANERAATIYESLQAQGVNLPECIVFSDEPSGDFGIAHASWWNDCAYVSFDDAYQPSEHTLYHELGHILNFYPPNRDAGILEAFWAEVGFTVTIDGANEQAEWHNSRGEAWAAWQCYAVETFADFFAWTFLGDRVSAMTWGVQLTQELRNKLLNFFKNWKGNDAVALTAADIETIATIVGARVAAAEVNILREILLKLDSGFNTTLPVLLNRLASGDKDVTTAVKET